MKPMRRWHDFASGREARRSPYREYGQAVRQSPEAKLAPAQVGRRGPTPSFGVVPKIGAGFVGLVAHIRDMRLLVPKEGWGPSASSWPPPILVTTTHGFHSEMRSKI